MKKILCICFLAIAIVSCEKTDNESSHIILSETIPGGCALESVATGDYYDILSTLNNQDTITYTFNNGILDIKVGFNATCCGTYATRSETINNIIYIYIQPAQHGLCDCICYYTYDFLYKGVTSPVHYYIIVDDYLKFEGIIDFQP